jgi:predicted phage terminase large subunit-like protein
MSQILTKTEYDALTRQDYFTFFVRSFHELHGAGTFQDNWHLEVLAVKLQAVVDGKIKRLIINIPPRHLKSLMASIALPAFILGRDPKASIICASYAQDLSDKFARDCRALMQSSWYQSIFPTRLTQSRAALQELITTKGGFRLGSSVGGVLTGRGADILIIDDPIKPGDAQSDARRNSANDWYDGTLYSRLNNKTEGAIILIMQRLHEDDLTGHLLQQEGWKLLSLPAIAEKDETFELENLFGGKTFTRKSGEALHEARESLVTLEQIRSSLGTYHFAAQYQQTPAPTGGGMVKQDWFITYTHDQLPLSFEQIIQCWDTANTPTELSDYTVCTTWGYKQSHFYLLNVYRKRVNFPDLKRAVIEQDSLFKPTIILIEDKASGTQLIQELIAAGISKVKGIKPEGDKIMRLHGQTATIENGFVHLPNEAPWLAEYLHEMSVFPNAKYDDQVDSTVYALAWATRCDSNMGMFEYYKQLAEAAGYRRAAS